MTDRLEPVRLRWQLVDWSDPPGLPVGAVAVLRLRHVEAEVQGRWMDRVRAVLGSRIVEAWAGESTPVLARLLLGAAVTRADGPAGRRWRAAWRRAEMVRTLAIASHRFDPAEAWTAGFLQGVGFEALAHLRPKTVQRLAESSPRHDPETPDRWLGVEPASLARRLIHQWRLGPLVAEAVGSSEHPLGRWIAAAEANLAGRTISAESGVDGSRMSTAQKAAEQKQRKLDRLFADPPFHAKVMRLLASAAVWSQRSDPQRRWVGSDPVTRLCSGPMPRTPLSAMRRVAYSIREASAAAAVGFCHPAQPSAPWVWFNHRLEVTLGWAAVNGTGPGELSHPKPLMQAAPQWAAAVPESVDPRSLSIRSLGRGAERVYVLAPSMRVSEALQEMWRLWLAIGQDAEAAQTARDAEAVSRRHHDRRREDRWRQALSQRVLAVTAGAAHEMNNPLMVISGRSQTLGAKLPADHPARLDAQRIQSAADELSGMIEHMHRLAEPYRPTLQPVTIARIVGETLQRARRGGVRSVRIIGRVPALTVRTDKEAIASAIAELLLNAQEVDPKTSPKLHTSVLRTNGRSIHVQVSDSGPGLSAEVLEHAFDPFYSVREAGRGAGMGLARARRWIEALGGRLSLANRRGGGAVATIVVPFEEEGGVGREQGTGSG